MLFITLSIKNNNIINGNVLLRDSRPFAIFSRYSHAKRENTRLRSTFNAKNLLLKKNIPNTPIPRSLPDQISPIFKFSHAILTLNGKKSTPSNSLLIHSHAIFSRYSHAKHETTRLRSTFNAKNLLLKKNILNTPIPRSLPDQISQIFKFSHAILTLNVKKSTPSNSLLIHSHAIFSRYSHAKRENTRLRSTFNAKNLLLKKDLPNNLIPRSLPDQISPIFKFSHAILTLNVKTPISEGYRFEY